MKTRIDFVSNSSSSSFILKDVGFFKYFGITKQDILDAIIDLYGGKEYCEKLLKEELARNENRLSLAKAELEKSKTDDEKKSTPWDIDFYSKRVEELKTKGLNRWCVYDMTNDKDHEKCFKEWDEHFSKWIAPNEGEARKWEELVEILYWQCGFDNIDDVLTNTDKELVAHNYDRSTKKYVDTSFSGGANIIRYIKQQLKVQTMKEVLHDKHCTLMIHFDDNEVYKIKGMDEPGKQDDKYCYSDSERAKAANAKWDSESYSADRFFEILIKYFISKGKIDLSDPKFLSYWEVRDDDTWFKKNYPDAKYYLKNDVATWKDVVDDCLNCNAIMHEG